MDPRQLFEQEKRENIERLRGDAEAWEYARRFMRATGRFKYTYNFEWLGRPVIQLPQDLIAMQEIIWRTRPDLVVETGIALGGSLIFYASMFELIGGTGHVLGVDIDIRAHNRAEIERHPLSRRISMIEGSSVEQATADKVYAAAAGKERVMVILDSNHTHAHVLKELELYSPLVKKGGYLLVFDTVIEDVWDDSYQPRAWDKGDNPKTAVWEFLKQNDRFEIDKEMDGKLVITAAPDGYLKCVKD